MEKMFACADRPLLMAVLNVTPDSFSDGGMFIAPDAAIAAGLRMAEDGADILDIGGESTRPGATPLPADEEIARIRPVVRALAGTLAIPISIDTYKARTAEAALEAGASIVNDVRGFHDDPDIARVAAEHGAGIVLMHSRPHEAAPSPDIRETIRGDLGRSLEIALAAGVSQDGIMLDPGIGFGKTPEQNLALAAEPGWLKAEFGLPVLIGASRKRLIARLTGAGEAADRLPGTLAVHVAAALAGADAIRAHDVAAHRDALRVVAAVRRMRHG